MKYLLRPILATSECRKGRTDAIRSQESEVRSQKVGQAFLPVKDSQEACLDSRGRGRICNRQECLSYSLTSEEWSSCISFGKMWETNFNFVDPR
jgi:hypothetical protein